MCNNHIILLYLTVCFNQNSSQRGGIQHNWYGLCLGTKHGHDVRHSVDGAPINPLVQLDRISSHVITGVPGVCGVS